MNKIENERINIRKGVEADMPALSQILNDPEVLKFYPMSNSKEVTEALKVWNYYMRQGSVYAVDIDHKTAGLAVVYVSSYKKLKRQALFAIVVGKKFRGKGVGTKLMEHIIDEAKNVWGIKLLHLEMYEGNPARSLYDRFGFKFYAEHKRFLKDAEGNYRSKVMMQLELE